MSEAPPSTQPAPAADGHDRPKILYLGGGHDAQVELQKRLGADVDVVELKSSSKVLALMGRQGYAGVYVDADRFAEANDVGRFLQNDRILRGMPEAVLLVDAENTILWGNGRLAEWTKQEDLVGKNFYQVLGSPEILGPDFCPLHTAQTSQTPSQSVLRCPESRYYRLHAAPVCDAGQTASSATPARRLIVTIHDISAEMLQQQKLAAIHQAGIELADLVADDVANLDYNERVGLLKDNILHCMQDVLHLDVIEIRTLDQKTDELTPLMAVGMEPAAAQRRLWAREKDNGVTGYVAATGQSYVCGNAQDDPLYLQGAKGARSSLTVPLMLHDDVIGTLNVESPELEAFNDSDLQFLEIFARNVAAALNTLELLAVEKATTAAASVEAIHSAVALPVDDILNDSVNVMERALNLDPEIVERLQRILRNARDIKKVIQEVGHNMAPAEAHPVGSLAETHPLMAGRRVLVVDPDEKVRLAAHDLLERYGCIVETAHDGAEARSMVRSLSPDARYDVIMAEIKLPDMTAYELLIKLREVVDYVPLVMMTGFGYDGDHTMVKVRREGYKYVLFKPFRVDQVEGAVEGTVEQRQQHLAESAMRH